MRDLECNWSVQVHSAGRYDDTIYRAVLAQWGGKRNLAWYSITCYNTAILSVKNFTDAFHNCKGKDFLLFTARGFSFSTASRSSCFNLDIEHTVSWVIYTAVLVVETSSGYYHFVTSVIEMSLRMKP